LIIILGDMDEEEQRNVRTHMALWTQRLHHHHRTLWEEEKHYTWWIYIIFAALILVYANKDIASVWRVILIFGGTAFGIFICLIGYTVVRMEAIEWYTTDEIVKRAMLYLKLYDVKVEDEGGKMFPLIPRPQIRDFATFKQTGKKVEQKKTMGDLFLGLIFAAYSKLPLTHSFRVWMRRILGGRVQRVELGIRDYFQITFLISAALFLAFMIFSCLTLRSAFFLS
jgi:hypothetical protein